MKLRYPIRLRLLQVRLQNLGKKVVIAVPLALVIKRDDEQVVSLQGFQHFFAVFPTSDSIA